jgi:trimeric autotransporter adhesin
MRVFLRMSFLCLLWIQLRFNCFAQSGIITTYAGSGSPGNVALATTEIFNTQASFALDGVGGLYVSVRYKHSVYHVTAAGQLHLTAGVGFPGYDNDGGMANSAALNEPLGLAVDSAGNLYIATSRSHRIRKVTPDGLITTIAGNGNEGYSGDGGPAALAQLMDSDEIAVDSAGNLYIPDGRSYRIRKVTPDGLMTTVAGNGNEGYSGDGGPATSARIGKPFGIAIDSAGNVYIADSENHRIRKVNPAGIITTIAGNGIEGYSGDGSLATSARIGIPYGIATDSEGNLYIADSWNRCIRKVNLDGIITTLAGNGSKGYSGNDGEATSAQLSFPDNVTVDSTGNLYFADYYDSIHSTRSGKTVISTRIRKVTPGGVITTIAGAYGKEKSFFGGDGGPATSAKLHNPSGVAVDSTGNLYIADEENSRIRQVTPAGIITTIAGGGSKSPNDGSPAFSARLSRPHGVAVDSAGNLYYADIDAIWIRKITPVGVIKHMGGGSSTQSSNSWLAGHPINSENEGFGPYGVAVDSAGNLYIADTDHFRIRKVALNGKSTTIAGNGKFGFSGDGGKATSAQLRQPIGVAADTVGNVYIADSKNHRIRKITPSGIITTVAGNGIGGYNGDGGQATSAQLSFPYGLAVDSADNLYIADTQNNRIRKVTPDGVITTVAGNGKEGYGGDGGPAALAQLRWPENIVVDSADNLYIADTGNNCIRKVGPSK